VNYYLQALSSKYADFSSRSRRSEYWFFTLFSFLAAIILNMVDIALGTFSYEAQAGLLTSIYGLLVLIPTLAVTVRRLHDIGKSGWAILKVCGGMFLTIVCALFIDALYLNFYVPSVNVSLLTSGIMLGIVLALCILFIVWLCTDSNPGHNRFGENPKNNSA